MRLSALAACTLATLAAGDLIHETEPSISSQSADQPEVEQNTDRKSYPVSSTIAAIAHPESVLDFLSGFASAPAVATESPQSQSARVTARETTIQPSQTPSAQAPALTNPSPARLPNFLKLTTAQVVQLQQRLKAQGFNPGEIDGILGPKTQAAIIAFQKARRLQVDGIVGAKTWATLNSSTSSTVTSFSGTKPGKNRPEAVSPNYSNAPSNSVTVASSKLPETAQPQSTPNNSSPQFSQHSFNIRLAAGFITGFSIPLTMLLVWQMVQTIRSPREEEDFSGYLEPQTDGLLQPGSDLPTEDQIELRNHCRAIAEILSKNDVSETVSNLEDTDKTLRVQFLQSR